MTLKTTKSQNNTYIAGSFYAANIYENRDGSCIVFFGFTNSDQLSHFHGSRTYKNLTNATRAATKWASKESK